MQLPLETRRDEVWKMVRQVEGTSLIITEGQRRREAHVVFHGIMLEAVSVCLSISVK